MLFDRSQRKDNVFARRSADFSNRIAGAPGIRILFTASCFPRYLTDHAGCFLGRLIRRHASRQNRFVVLAPDDTTTCGPFFVPVVRFRYFFKQFQILAYRSGIPQNLKQNPWLWLMVPFYLAALTRMMWRLSRQVDVLWSHWAIPAGVIGAVIARLRGLPHVTTCHGTDVEWIARMPRRLGGLLAKIVYHGSREVTFVNLEAREQFYRAMGMVPDEAKSPVIPMVEQPRPDAVGRTHKDAALRILFMGRLVPDKGADLLIAAARSRPDVALWIAGDGPELPRLRLLAAGAQADIRFLGWLGGEDKTTALQWSDVLCVPSRSRNATEGFPAVIAEAWSQGKPVLASTAGGIPTLVTDRVNGFLFAADDHAALESQIDWLTRNRRSLPFMSPAIIRFAQELSARARLRFDSLLANFAR